MNNNFNTILKDACPFGIIVGVALPPQDQRIPNDIWRKLRKEEQNYSKKLNGFRKTTWIGGRIAAHTACNILGVDSGPILTAPKGEPTISNDISLSISHKDTMAIAICAKAKHGTLGVDLEKIGKPRMGIMKKVLSDKEQEEVMALPIERQWNSLLLRFSTKEALYKSLAPKLKRYIGFNEAEVFPQTNGNTQIMLKLNNGPFPKKVEARYIWHNEYIITAVRVTW